MKETHLQSEGRVAVGSYFKADICLSEVELTTNWTRGGADVDLSMHSLVHCEDLITIF